MGQEHKCQRLPQILPRELPLKLPREPAWEMLLVRKFRIHETLLAWLQDLPSVFECKWPEVHVDDHWPSCTCVEEAGSCGLDKCAYVRLDVVSELFSAESAIVGTLNDLICGGGGEGRRRSKTYFGKGMVKIAMGVYLFSMCLQIDGWICLGEMSKSFVASTCQNQYWQVVCFVVEDCFNGVIPGEDEVVFCAESTGKKILGLLCDLLGQNKINGDARDVVCVAR
eukprot:15367208-Ditylum_brightwellii.AAC.2